MWPEKSPSFLQDALPWQNKSLAFSQTEIIHTISLTHRGACKFRSRLPPLDTCFPSLCLLQSPSGLMNKHITVRIRYFVSGSPSKGHCRNVLLGGPLRRVVRAGNVIIRYWHNQQHAFRRFILTVTRQWHRFKSRTEIPYIARFSVYQYRMLTYDIRDLGRFHADGVYHSTWFMQFSSFRHIHTVDQFDWYHISVDRIGRCTCSRHVFL